MPRMLVAGVGNVFLGDDGFGVEVARRLAAEPLPDWVRVADFGLRGLHLAYELMEGGYDIAVLADATARGGPAGTVYLIEPDPASLASPTPDPSGMSPEAVLATVRMLGGQPGRVLILGCEPANTEEGIGLSPSVAQGVDEALKLARELIEREAGVRVSGAGG